MEQRTEGRSKTRTPSFTILFQSAENLLTQSLRSNTLKKIGKLFATETELEGQRIEKDKAEYFRAVQTGEFQVAKELVEKYGYSSFINSRDHELSQSALHIASQEGYEEIVTWILECNQPLQINARDKNGWAPLHCACNGGNLTIAKKLILAGADVNCITNNFSTPLHYLVKTRISSKTSENIEKLEIQMKELLQLFIDKGLKINAVNQNSETAFHLACLYGNTELVLLLYQFGANINALNKNGESGLDYADRAGYYDLMDTIKTNYGHLNLIQKRIFPPLLRLPNDVLYEILILLGPEDLCSLSLVCSRFHKLANESRVWQYFCRKLCVSFPLSGKQEDFNFKNMFIRWYKGWQDYESYPDVDWQRCKRIPSQTREYNHLFKILVVGDSGTGKSSTISRFVDRTFSNSKTSLHPWDFKRATLELESQIVQLTIWDTSNCRNRPWGSRYYRGAHGVIIMFDVCDLDSWNNVKNWLEEIRRYACENVCKLIVGNKTDLACNMVVNKEVIQSLCEDHGVPFVLISCKFNYNVDLVFSLIALSILRRVNQTDPEHLNRASLSVKVSPFYRKEDKCTIM